MINCHQTTMLKQKIKLAFSSLHTVICCILLLTLTLNLPAQMQSTPGSTVEPPATPYWQQEVHYDIHVTLNDIQHSLKGNESFEYINHSPDTLTYIYIHLWPNAYKNTSTAL